MLARAAIFLLSAALVICLFVGYTMYRNLSIGLENERLIRENHEMLTAIALYEYSAALARIEQRQCNVEEIFVQSSVLNMTFANLRNYNRNMGRAMPQPPQMLVGGP